MRFKTISISTLIFIAVSLSGSQLLAQSTESKSFGQPASKTLTIVVKGTLGPILSGQDPLGADGQGGKLTVKASESLSPQKHTSNSATYRLPAGAMTVTFGSNHFQTTSPSTMTVKLTSTADVLTLVASGPDKIEVTGTAYLKTGSWTTAVLKHPTVFKPSPQTLKSAKTASGPGSKVKYTFFGSPTVLGLTGNATCSQAAGAEVPEGDSF